MRDDRPLGADRPPFKVGQTVIVLMAQPAGKVPLVPLVAQNMAGYAGGSVVILDAMVLTTPGSVGAPNSPETPGYTVAITQPDGSITARQVDKSTIWRPEDRPLLMDIVFTAKEYHDYSALKRKALEDAQTLVDAKHSPTIKLSYTRLEEAIQQLRTKTMPMPTIRKHTFKQHRYAVTVCQRTGCGKPRTDPIHKQ